MEEINTLLKFNKDLHDLAEEKLKLNITDGDNSSFFTAFAVGKAFKTYEAIGLLCKGGYGEDAFMLTRTLFELMVTTIYILQDTTEDRLTRYLSYDWVTRKEMYDYSPVSQLTANIPGITTGRNSMSAVTKSAQTKIANGTINNMSASTAVKAAVSTQASDIYRTAIGAAVDVIQSIFGIFSNDKKK